MQTKTLRYAEKVILLSVLVCQTCLLAESIRLVVDTKGEGKQPFPVRGGVPFARGALTSTDHVRLLRGAEELPCQVTRTAVWPDGSIKWVLLDFLGPAGEGYQLEYGQDVRRADVPRRVSVQHGQGNVQVDTGMVRFRVRAGGPGWLESLAFDANGNGKYVPEEAILDASATGAFLDFNHLTDPDHFDPLLPHAPHLDDPSKEEIVSVEVEQAGPMHAVVRVQGRYRYAHLGSTYNAKIRKGVCDFYLWIHAYAGLGRIDFEHFFIYDGAPDADVVRSLGLRFGLTGLPAKTVSAGTEKDWALSDFSRGGLFQETPDDFRVWGQRKPTTADLTLDRGRRSRGWIDVSGQDWGVTLGIRRAFQNAPNSLLWETNGHQTHLTAFLWPLEAGMLNFRRYSREWSVGETGSDDPVEKVVGYSRYAAKGVGKTHKFSLAFHRGNKPADVAPFEDTPLLKAPANYVARTEVLGLYLPQDAERFADHEKAMSASLDYWFAMQEQFRWYGFLDYGAVQQWFNKCHRNGRWENDFGRWGWAGNDGAGRTAALYLFHYLRSGDRRYFDFGEASARHIFDMDIVHTKEYPWDFGAWRNVAGCAHRHNLQHWGCPYVGARGAHPVGQKILYFLTGDERMRLGLEEVTDMAVGALGGDVQRLGHSGDAFSADGGGAALQALLWAWETTGDKKYQSLIEKYLAGRSWEPKSNWEAVITTSFGCFQGMSEYYRLTGDERWLEAFRKMADTCATEQTRKHWSYPEGYLRIFSDAYLFLGDEKYRTELELAMKRLFDGVRGEAQMFFPPEQWPGPPGSISPGLHANAWLDVPYALEALVRKGGK